MISPQSQNPYVYCMNNPLRFVDPSGMTLADDPGYVPGCLETYYGGEYHYFPAMNGYCNVSGLELDYGDAVAWRNMFDALYGLLYGSTQDDLSSFAKGQSLTLSGLPGEYYKNMTPDKYNPCRYGDKSTLSYVLFSYTPPQNPTASIYIQYVYETATGRSQVFHGVSPGISIPGGMAVVGFLDFDTIEEYRNTQTMDMFVAEGLGMNFTFAKINDDLSLVGVGVVYAYGKNAGITSSADYVDTAKDVLGRIAIIKPSPTEVLSV